VSTILSDAAPQPDTAVAEPNPRRWLVLAVIAIAQLMVILDATIVNIAMPKAQAALDISNADRQWMVTAYTLTFGGLLLLGGRIADYWGRKRTFVVGAAGFAVASALGGLAQNAEMLFGARALQGAFGALLAPAGLALLTVLFVEAKERAKAFAVYGAISGGGAAVGLVLGGVLTEYLDWRWCLLVNIPVALIAIALAVPLVPESRAQGDTRYDIPGAVVVTAALVSLVYGFTKAVDLGWSSKETLGFIAAGLVLLVVFVFIEANTKHPLLPLRIILDRNRGGAFLTSMFIGVGLMGAFLFLGYYLQGVLLYTPVQAGLASLPVTLGVFIAAGSASALIPKIGPKVLMATGPVLAAGAMLWLTQLEVADQFWTLVFPAQVLLGLGLGFGFVPMGSLALFGVPEHDAGAASATLNATQQIGGSLGLALLNTFATTATTDYLADHTPAGAPKLTPEQFAQLPAELKAQVMQLVNESTVHGFSVGFAWGAGFLLIASVVAVVLIRVRKEELADAPKAVHVG
jgi:EmrB/QacA subfamily drug resistance transporter